MDEWNGFKQTDDGKFYTTRMLTYRDIVQQAQRLMKQQLRRATTEVKNSRLVRNYIRTQIGTEKAEQFGVMFLDIRYRMIEFEVLAKGSLCDCSVSPRILVQKVLEHNAYAVVLGHNHPSGDCTPSKEDLDCTDRIKNALDLIEVRVLDHVVVSPWDTYSFAEEGLL